MLYVIHKWGDDVYVSPCKTGDDVREYVKSFELEPKDYWLIHGKVLKSEENTLFDIEEFDKEYDVTVDVSELLNGEEKGELVDAKTDGK